jgi:hypothetical protein
LRAAREKHKVTYKGKLIKITDLSIEILKAMRTRRDAFQVLKENNCQSVLLFPQKMHP